MSKDIQHIKRSMVVDSDDLKRKVRTSKTKRVIKFEEEEEVESDKVAIKITMEGKPSAFKYLESRGIISEPGDESPPDLQLILQPSRQSTLVDDKDSKD